MGTETDCYWYSVFRVSCLVNEDPSQYWYVVTEYGWDEGLIYCPFCKTERDHLDSINRDEYHRVEVLGDLTLSDILRVMTPYEAKELMGE